MVACQVALPPHHCRVLGLILSSGYHLRSVLCTILIFMWVSSGFSAFTVQKHADKQISFVKLPLPGPEFPGQGLDPLPL